MSQDTESPPSIDMNNYQLEVVKESTCLRSTVTDNLDICPELNRRIAWATSIVAKLSKRVYENHKLTTNTKMAVYRACVLSTLLYGSESWTLYSREEKRLNTFHMWNLRRILGIKWSDRLTKTRSSNALAFPASYINTAFVGLVTSCQQDARRQDPQGPPVRRACIREESLGSSAATVQRRA